MVATDVPLNPEQKLEAEIDWMAIEKTGRSASSFKGAGAKVAPVEFQFEDSRVISCRGAVTV